MKIKKGDEIIVVSGKDRGRKGKVDKTLPRKQAVLVTDLNLVKKHLRAQGEKKPGGIVQIPKPLNVAKIALVCPQCHQPTRVGYKIEKKEKFRICKKCQELIDK